MTVVHSSFTAPTGKQTTGGTACPAGQTVVGGGASSDSLSPAVNINSSYPVGISWVVDMNNASGASSVIFAYAICATTN